MKVSINYDRCISTAACMAAAPGVFEVKGDGTWVLQEHPSEELRHKVLMA
ncbi:MAG: ferredoxin, partial [Chloroflexi bacterium]|nr:ferredoxin [Chloroflexota bacterium]